MTPAQEKDSADIRERFNELQEPKYLKGAIEYKNNVWDLTVEQLVDEAEAEFIDGFTYVYHIRLKVEKMRELIKRQQQMIEDLERINNEN